MLHMKYFQFAYFSYDNFFYAVIFLLVRLTDYFEFFNILILLNYTLLINFLFIKIL